LTVELARAPSTSISARPTALPWAWSTLNRTQRTVLGGNRTGSTRPFPGSAGTATWLRSLKSSVPANTSSPVLGRPHRLTCAIRTGSSQSSWIQAPASSPSETQACPGSPLTIPSTAMAAKSPPPAFMEEAVTAAVMAMLVPKSLSQKNSSLRANELNQRSPG